MKGLIFREYNMLIDYIRQHFNLIYFYFSVYYEIQMHGELYSRILWIFLKGF